MTGCVAGAGFYALRAAGVVASDTAAVPPPREALRLVVFGARREAAPGQQGAAAGPAGPAAEAAGPGQLRGQGQQQEGQQQQQAGQQPQQQQRWWRWD
jgi:hypothetical protein